MTTAWTHYDAFEPYFTELRREGKSETDSSRRRAIFARLSMLQEMAIKVADSAASVDTLSTHVLETRHKQAEMFTEISELIDGVADSLLGISQWLRSGEQSHQLAASAIDTEVEALRDVVFAITQPQDGERNERASTSGHPIRRCLWHHHGRWMGWAINHRPG